MATKTMKLAGVVLGLLLWGVAQAGTRHYYYTDPQGTPLAKADAQGNIVERYEYTPYGVPVPSMGASPDGPSYTGHVNDPETGLVYMQARYYDPEVGRFIGVDPISAGVGGRYTYVVNNPIANIDPDGRMEDSGQCSNIECKRNRQSERERKHNEPYTGGGVVRHMQADRRGVTSPSPQPKATSDALKAIFSSPQGQAILQQARRDGEEFDLALMPFDMKPMFHYEWNGGNDVILYSLNVSAFVKKSDVNGELLSRLDVFLMHEIGHTPAAAKAFGFPFTPSFNWNNEFNVIRFIENPYRAFKGLPLRETYGGYAVPPPLLTR